MDRIESKYRKEGTLTKVKNTLGKYVPKPGLSGLIGSVIGTYAGATVGFLGSAGHYLYSEGASYLLNGGGLNTLGKVYESGVKGCGQGALLGGVIGMLLFATTRDRILRSIGWKK